MTHLGELISAYLDGEASPDEADRVVEHVASCERCRNEMADVHLARNAVRGLPIVEVPEGLFDTGVDADVIPLHRRTMAWVAAAAAAVLIFVVSASIAAPDAIGVTLSDLSRYHNQQQQIDPGIAPHIGISAGAPR